MIKISEYIFKRFLAGVFFYALFGVLFLHGEALATTVEFTLAGSSGIESVTPADIELHLDESSVEDVTVDYALTGTATGGGMDYTLSEEGQATITAGNTTTSISADIVNDLLDESDETIIVTISNPVNADLGIETEHTYTIEDDDDPPTVSFTGAPYIHAETDAQTVTVTLSAASGKEVSVGYATSDGTASASSDYTAASGTRTWAIGETGAKTFDILITADDVLDEGDETVTITLSMPVNCTIDGTNPEKLTIIDNICVLVVGSESGDYPTIRAALNAAGDDCTVIVRNGTYTGPDNRDLDFNGPAITVRSESYDPNLCIIDCENLGRGFWFHSGEGENSKLSGFSIINGVAFDGGGLYFTGGSSPTIENCSIRWNTALYGAGINCSESSSPNFNNCIISDNHSNGSGGGIYCTGASSPVIARCIIGENYAKEVGKNYAKGYGGGIYLNDGSAAVISQCDIVGNECGYDGGGVFIYMSSADITASKVSSNSADAGGGGIFCQGYISPSVRDCVISKNKAVRGGGIFCQSGSVAEITGCSITGNESIAYGGGGILCSSASPIIRNCEINDNSSPSHTGGGISCLAYADPVLINCVISRNAAVKGGGISCYESDPDLFNCTVTMNTTDSGGGAISCVFSSPTITNSILWGDTPDEISLYSSEELAASFCIVAGGYPAGGNIIDKDPLFVNQGGGDYHLYGRSPCRDAGTGTPDGVPVDDIEGNPRGVKPCIGAYEYVPRALPFLLPLLLSE